jgi:hypothetical protein
MLTATQTDALITVECAIDADIDQAMAQPAEWHGAYARRPVRFSRHAHTRAARRNLVPDAVEYVLTNGRQVQRTGVTFYFLGWRDMPGADQRASWASRLEGTVVLVAPNGEVVTVYRNRRALRAILKKMKYRLLRMDQGHKQDLSEIESLTSVAGDIAPLGQTA